MAWQTPRALMGIDANCARGSEGSWAVSQLVWLAKIRFHDQPSLDANDANCRLVAVGRGQRWVTIRRGVTVIRCSPSNRLGWSSRLTCKCPRTCLRAVIDSPGSITQNFNWRLLADTVKALIGERARVQKELTKLD